MTASGYRTPTKAGKPLFFFTKLSRNLSWTHVSGVGQQIWVWGSTGRQYKITREKVKNSNKLKI